MPLSQSSRLTPIHRILGFALAILAFSSIAQGAEDRAWFVVVNDSEPVRCMDQEIYYTVQEYTKGMVVQSDGISGDYTKIRYPAGLGAFVPARDSQSVDGGKRVRLIDDSQLAAVSMLRGFDGSWCPVFAEPLEAGTELSVTEVMHDGNDEVVGYRVAPPAPSVAGAYPYIYIRTDALRPATASEIKIAQGGKPTAASRPKLTAGPEHTKVKKEPEPIKPLPEPVKIETKPEAEMVDLREEMVIPATEPEIKEPTAASSAKPAVIKNTIPKVVYTEKSGTAHRSTPLTAAGLEALEASFVNARLMPREQLDEALPELLAEFTRARNASGVDESEIRPLNQRIEWLNIRIQTRDQRRAIAQALSTADQQSLVLNGKIEQWNASRSYALVGRLMLSGVYTGEHLPLLYRVRAPDPITGIERTIGYVSPKADQDLRRYLGRVIGVVGDPVHDDALSMTVLSPLRVDLMPGQ